MTSMRLKSIATNQTPQYVYQSSSEISTVHNDNRDTKFTCLPYNHHTKIIKNLFKKFEYFYRQSWEIIPNI